MTKLKNQNFDNSKTQIVQKLKFFICDKTQKLKLWQNSKTQILTKLKLWQNSQNSNCDKNWWDFSGQLFAISRCFMGILRFILGEFAWEGCLDVAVSRWQMTTCIVKIIHFLVSVLPSAHVERFSVSRIQDFLHLVFDDKIKHKIISKWINFDDNFYFLFL